MEFKEIGGIMQYTEIKYNSEREWHNIRASGIGGSDASIIFGKNPWKTSRKLWREKTGLEESEDLSEKEAIIKGNMMEEPLLNILRARHPDWKIKKPNVTYKSNEYPFMLANLDGIADTENDVIGIEIKTATVRGLGIWKEDIPIYYYLQILHYMIVTGIRKFVLFAYIENFENTLLKEYVIEYDSDDAQALIEKEKIFWECVETKTQPEIEYTLEF